MDRLLPKKRPRPTNQPEKMKSPFDTTGPSIFAKDTKAKASASLAKTNLEALRRDPKRIDPKPINFYTKAGLK